MMTVLEKANQKRDAAERGMGYGLPGYDWSHLQWWTAYIEGAEDQKREDAAAIEELDAEETRLLLITSELQDKVVELEEELNDADIATDDNGRQVEELQAEIERLKDSNEELRERQTYIDHYGIEWLTSAKDVPNYAYEHGYADGMAEVKAQLPKRGKWIETEEEEWGIYPFKKQTCSVCDCKIDHTFMLACMDYFDDRDTVFHYCPNCGAKMEVQE